MRRGEPVRFWPVGRGVDEAGRLEHVVRDTMCRQQSAQPGAVTARLKTADNANRRVDPGATWSRSNEIRAGKAAASRPAIRWRRSPPQGCVGADRLSPRRDERAAYKQDDVLPAGHLDPISL